jgi:nitrous oxidase accessory protein NosD
MNALGKFGLMVGFAIPVVAAGPAVAAVLYVAANGAGGVCGAASQPCRSIAAAVGNAVSGDRIVVGPGVYGAFVLDRTVTLESAGGAGATIIRGAGAGTVVDVQTGADGAVIGRTGKGFTVQNGDSGIAVAANDVVITDNIVSAVVDAVTVQAAASRVAVTGNLIFGAFVGIGVEGPDASITRNVVQAVVGGTTGIELVGLRTVVTDNVVTGADTGAVVDAGSATIRRNTFAANGDGIRVQGAQTHAVITSNNLLGNATNCGIRLIGSAVTATGNYWGSATGPGSDPADGVCGSSAVTTPFLKAPVTVNTAGWR